MGDMSHDTLAHQKIYQKYNYNLLEHMEILAECDHGLRIRHSFFRKFGYTFADGTIFFFPFVLCGLNFGRLAT
jgi:hypothetical protein